MSERVLDRAPAASRSAEPLSDGPDPRLVVWGVPAAILLGAGMVVLGGMLAVAAIFAMGVVALVAVRPAAGAYLYLGVTPLVAGISRDLFLPTIRIHEALLGLIVGGLLVRGVARMISGHVYRLNLSRVDRAMVILVVAGSMVSMLWRFAQGEPITTDDVLYAVVFWKYLALYGVFRIAVTTTREAATALWVALGATAVVASIGVLQALGLFGVPELLFRWYPAFLGEVAEVGRGASTLGLTFAVADVCLIAAAAAVSLGREATGRARGVLFTLTAVYVLGAIAAGQFSGFIGIVVAMVALGFALGEVRRVLRHGAIAGAIGAVLTWPVIVNRLGGFQSSDGVPQSWSGRLDNLSGFILPRFANGWNILFGVRPAARVPAPETWRDWVFIESGYLWLLWSGGIPLLAAFFYFMFSSLKMLRETITRQVGELRAIATGAFVGLWVVLVLTILDPHLTMRGVADLLFPLIAMAPLANTRTAGVGAPRLDEVMT